MSFICEHALGGFLLSVRLSGGWQNRLSVGLATYLFAKNLTKNADTCIPNLTMQQAATTSRVHSNQGQETNVSALFEG
jgi:hypothetical protein